jgi:hypothetical protein
MNWPLSIEECYAMSRVRFYADQWSEKYGIRLTRNTQIAGNRNEDLKKKSMNATFTLKILALPSAFNRHKAANRSKTQLEGFPDRVETFWETAAVGGRPDFRRFICH